MRITVQSILVENKIIGADKKNGRVGITNVNERKERNS